MSAPSPPGTTFIDTDILIYSHDTHDETKHRVAEKLLTQLWTSGLGVLSTQVLQEFYRAATRKLRPALTPKQARQVATRSLLSRRVDTLVPVHRRLLPALLVGYPDVRHVTDRQRPPLPV